MNAKWFCSRTVRQSAQMRKHVQKLLNSQRDILQPKNITAVQDAIDALKRTEEQGTREEVQAQVSKLADIAEKNLKTPPNASIRENIEVLLVAIAVAMGIRTFFLQPFKIPTGSMQPTLYGITSNSDFKQSVAFPTELGPRPDFEIPNPLTRFLTFWWSGIQYKHVVARTGGALRSWDETPTKFLLFNLKQKFYIGDDLYVVWFPPEDMLKRAGLVNYWNQPNPKVFKAGEDIIKIKVIAGDHLFVDRVTYNFRRPERGEIVVFDTHGIQRLKPDQQDTFYIKRLCGLGGEKLQLKRDYEVEGVPGAGEPVPVGHLVANGREITSATRHFEHLYGFADAPQQTRTNQHPVIPYRENHYVGHALIGELSPGAQFQVRDNHYFVMGDNTMNSSDSRYWGDFPRKQVIGKSFFVYWPIGRQDSRESRFGWGQQ